MTRLYISPQEKVHWARNASHRWTKCGSKTSDLLWNFSRAHRAKRFRLRVRVFLPYTSIGADLYAISATSALQQWESWIINFQYWRTITFATFAYDHIVYCIADSMFVLKNYFYIWTYYHSINLCALNVQLTGTYTEIWIVRRML